MIGDRQVVQALNKNLGAFLISINQYFLHARILKNWGFEDMGNRLYKQSICDMKSADALVERILLLEGLPNVQEYGKILVGEDLEDLLKCDEVAEKRKHLTLVDGIAICEAKQDFVSRALLEQQKDINEEYWDWLGTQLTLMKSMGLENYAQHAAHSC